MHDLLVSFCFFLCIVFLLIVVDICSEVMCYWNSRSKKNFLSCHNIWHDKHQWIASYRNCMHGNLWYKCQMGLEESLNLQIIIAPSSSSLPCCVVLYTSQTTYHSTQNWTLVAVTASLKTDDDIKSKKMIVGIWLWLARHYDYLVEWIGWANIFGRFLHLPRLGLAIENEKGRERGKRIDDLLRKDNCP